MRRSTNKGKTSVSADTVEGRLARIEESLVHFREDRIEAREDRRQLINEFQLLRNDFAGIKQNLLSAQNVISELELEKRKDVVGTLEKRIERVEYEIKGLPVITEKDAAAIPHVVEDYDFWKKLLGTGFQAVWKIALIVISSGGFASLITHWLWK